MSYVLNYKENLNLLKNKTRSKETLAFMLEAFFLILVVKAKIMDPDYLLKTLFKKKISAAFHSFAWFKHFLDNGLIFEKKNRYRNEQRSYKIGQSKTYTDN